VRYRAQGAAQQVRTWARRLRAVVRCGRCEILQPSGDVHVQHRLTARPSMQPDRLREEGPAHAGLPDQHPVVEQHLDVLLIDAGQLGADLQVALRDLDARPVMGRDLRCSIGGSSMDPVLPWRCPGGAAGSCCACHRGPQCIYASFACRRAPMPTRSRACLARQQTANGTATHGRRSPGLVGSIAPRSAQTGEIFCRN